MKAAVFCNFAGDLSDRLKANLIERGVNIVYFGGIDSNTKVSNPGCEGIIAFFEIMSHAQTDKVKGWARDWNVPYFLLSRKSATWGKQLPDLKAKQATTEVVKPNSKAKSLVYTETIVHPPEVVEEAPPSIQAPVADEALDRQWDEIKELFIEEVEGLKKENEDLKTKLGESMRQRTHLVSQVDDFKKRIEHKDHQMDDLKKEVSQFQTTRDQMQAYKKVYEEMKGQLEVERKSLASALLDVSALQKQLDYSVTAEVHNDMMTYLKAKIQELEGALKKASSTSTAPIDPTITSIQHLFNLKMLDEETAGKMLVKAILHGVPGK